LTLKAHPRSAFAAINLLALLAAAPAPVAAQAAMVDFHVAAGPLDKALVAFAAQSGVQLIYSPQTVQGRQAPALVGRFTIEAGLARLIAESGIAVYRPRAGVLVLRQGVSRTRDPGPPPARLDDSAAPTTATAPPPPASTPARADDATGKQPTRASELVVTGSQIHGASPGASHVVAIDRDDLDNSGQATVAGMLAVLPQNFAATAQPSTFLIGSDGLGNNFTVAQGVNLRGLGAQATLVLVDGHRLAGVGINGDFADLSSVPTAAVERVEVLLDGASAIYGSDAVGGVVNIITRQSFTGDETRVRFSIADGGDAAQTQISNIFGQDWSGGHFTVAYEYEHDEPLAARDRAFTATADLVPWGGTDYRQIYANPGNILAYDAASGGFVSAFAIPYNPTGTGLTAADFIPGATNYNDFRRDADIEPEQDRHSVYADLRQSLTSAVTLDLNARYTYRSFSYNTPAASTILQITGADPYFIPVGGEASELIGYSFENELGPIVTNGSEQSLNLAASLNIDLPRSWHGEIYAAYAREDGVVRQTHELDSNALEEELGNAPPTGGYDPAQLGYFNPYGSGRANSPALLAFISQRERTSSLGQEATVDAQADGTVIDLPGGPLKAALGAQFRLERFTPFDQEVSAADEYASGGTAYQRTVIAGFLELRAPLVGPNNAIPGVQALEASLAGRVEAYNDVGISGVPKLGLLWTPFGGLDIHATYGRSFRAPSLVDINALQVIAPGILPSAGSQALVLVRYGGNPALRPETATSWTLGAKLKPRFAPNLVLDVTAFDVVYRDQVGTPVLTDIENALSNPAYAPFVTRVSPATNPADLALVESLIAQSGANGGNEFPATAYTAIVDARSVNAAETHVRGLDLTGTYAFAWGENHFTFTASATYLLDYQRQLTQASPLIQLVSTAGEPIDFRGRFAIGWSRGPWGAQAAVNYQDGYRAGEGPMPNAYIDPWTTIDLQWTWRAPWKQGPMAGLVLTLAAQNLLNANPPFYDSPQGVAYDPANAGPLGRVVSIQATKRW
jgi:outer membrane receptor protein involved in Fe transport